MSEQQVLKAHFDNGVIVLRSFWQQCLNSKIQSEGVKVVFLDKTGYHAETHFFLSDYDNLVAEVNPETVKFFDLMPQTGTQALQELWIAGTVMTIEDWEGVTYLPGGKPVLVCKDGDLTEIHLYNPEDFIRMEEKCGKGHVKKLNLRKSA